VSCCRRSNPAQRDHLLSLGMIEPVPEPEPATEPVPEAA
jgi:hypothetical protein